MKNGILAKGTCIIVVFLVFALIFPATGLAKKKDADSKKYVIGESRIIPSKILKEKRVILISTPDGYDTTKVSYPVLYVLDGKAHFHYTTGIVKFLSDQGLMPQVIVIGIPNTDRDRDFTPTVVKNRPTSGGGENFLQFMREELMPYVEKNYRTAPYDILFGHSLTGTFAVYSLLTTSDIFNAYIAASPWLAYDNNFIIKEAEGILSQKSNCDGFLYMTLGDEPNSLPSIQEFVTLLKNMPPRSLIWKLNIMDDEDHGSLTLRTMLDGLEMLFTNWRPSPDIIKVGVEAIEKHYQDLSQRFGYTIDAPENVLNNLGYQLLFQKKPEKAIAVFKLNVEKYPYSGNVYDSLGEAYEKNNQFDLAAKNYKFAIKKGKDSHPYFLETFKKNLARVQQKKAEQKK